MKVLIAAGGTGGTLYPGIAIAQGIMRRAPDAEVIFVGAGRPVEVLALQGTPWKLVTFPMPRIKGQSFIVRLWTILKLPIVLMRAALLVRRLRPSFVLGIGGYAAGPVPLAAAFQGIPMAIVVPDVIPGLANRLLARFARRIFIQFPEAEAFFPSSKVVISGGVVRDVILSGAKDLLETLSEGDSSPMAQNDKSHFTILCTGGSQGAASLNRAVADALPRLHAQKISFIHQTGMQEDVKALEQKYARAGVAARVTPFLDRMWESLAKADLVIARAGSSTIAELVALAKPAILVPYPYAADDHQRANAEAAVRMGGAIMILDRELSGERLAAEIIDFIAHPERLANMRAMLEKNERGCAADRIVEECWRMMHAE